MNMKINIFKKAVPIIDQKKEYSLFCPKCEKWKTVLPAINFFELEALWGELMLQKVHIKCKCGMSTERKIRIGKNKEFYSPEDYFKKCYGYMKRKYKQNVVSNMLKHFALYDEYKTITYCRREKALSISHEFLFNPVIVYKNPLKAVPNNTVFYFNMLKEINLLRYKELDRLEHEERTALLVEELRAMQDTELEKYDKYQSFNGRYYIIKSLA